MNTAEAEFLPLSFEKCCAMPGRIKVQPNSNQITQFKFSLRLIFLLYSFEQLIYMKIVWAEDFRRRCKNIINRFKICAQFQRENIPWVVKVSGQRRHSFARFRVPYYYYYIKQIALVYTRVRRGSRRSTCVLFSPRSNVKRTLLQKYVF